MCCYFFVPNTSNEVILLNLSLFSNFIDVKATYSDKCGKKKCEDEEIIIYRPGAVDMILM